MNIILFIKFILFYALIEILAASIVGIPILLILMKYIIKYEDKLYKQWK